MWDYVKHRNKALLTKPYYTHINLFAKRIKIKIFYELSTFGYGCILSIISVKILDNFPCVYVPFNIPNQM